MIAIHTNFPTIGDQLVGKLPRDEFVRIEGRVDYGLIVRHTLLTAYLPQHHFLRSLVVLPVIGAPPSHVF